MPYACAILLLVIGFERMVMHHRQTSIFVIYAWASMIPMGGYTVLALTPYLSSLDQITYSHVAGFDRFFAVHVLCLWAGYSLFRFSSSMLADPAPRLAEFPDDDANDLFFMLLVVCTLFSGFYCAVSIRAIFNPAHVGPDGQLLGSQVGEVSLLDRIGSYITILTPWLIGLVNYSPGRKFIGTISTVFVMTTTLIQSSLLASRGGLTLVGVLLFFSLRVHDRLRWWHLLVGCAALAGLTVIRGTGGSVGFIFVFLMKVVGNVVADSYIYDFHYWTEKYHSFHFFAVGRFIAKTFIGNSDADLSPAEFFIPAFGGYPWNTGSILGGFVFNFPPALVLAGCVAAGGALRIFDVNSDSPHNLSWALRPVMATTAFLAPSALLLSSPQVFTDMVLVILLFFAGRLGVLSFLARRPAELGPSSQGPA